MKAMDRVLEDMTEAAHDPKRPPVEDVELGRLIVMIKTQTDTVLASYGSGMSTNVTGGQLMAILLLAMGGMTVIMQNDPNAVNMYDDGLKTCQRCEAPHQLNAEGYCLVCAATRKAEKGK